MCFSWYSRHVDADHVRARRRTGTRRARARARSCRRRSGRGTGSADRPVRILAGPARARRTAAATASTAASWPTTRLRSRSSILLRRSASPSSIFSTGMPVHFATTAAMSSSVTSSRRKPPFARSCLDLRAIVARSRFSSSGSVPNRSSDARAKSPLRCAARPRSCACSSFSFAVAQVLDELALALPLRLHRARPAP